MLWMIYKDPHKTDLMKDEFPCSSLLCLYPLAMFTPISSYPRRLRHSHMMHGPFVYDFKFQVSNGENSSSTSI
jgi:hypothetical protein